MPSEQTPTAEPRQRFTPEQLFHALERNRGRLQAVEFACFGLSNGTGNDAACLVWILSDVLADLDVMESTLEDMIVLEGASTEIPIPRN